MGVEKAIFQRIERLVGEEVMSHISRTKVILFGVGGVGSWCAESLVRSGISHLTLVDSDRVAVSNINRQLMATTKTVGRVKVEMLKERLLDINPNAEIISIRQIYSADTADLFKLEDYDYVVDAIDSLESKALLIRLATKTNATLVSSMGAALKMDPSRIQVAEFWNVKGCPLGAALRRKIKQGELPAKKFFCVYSDEVLPNRGKEKDYTKLEELIPKIEEEAADSLFINHKWDNLKAQVNGTMPHITAIFGFTLAGLIMEKINEMR